MSQLFSDFAFFLEVLPWWFILALCVLVFLFSMLWYGALFGKTVAHLQGRSMDACSPHKLGMVIQLCEYLVLVYFLSLLITHLEFSLFLLLLDAFLGTLLFGLLAGAFFSSDRNSVAWKLWGIHAGFYCIAICSVSATLFLFT